MRKKYPPLNEYDFVKVLFQDGLKNIKEGTVILQDDNKSILDKDGKYKIDLHNGFVGWHERHNLRIIKRHKVKNGRIN